MACTNAARDRMHQRIGTPDTYDADDIFDATEDRGTVHRPRTGNLKRKSRKRLPRNKRFTPPDPIAHTIARQKKSKNDSHGG